MKFQIKICLIACFAIAIVFTNIGCKKTEENITKNNERIPVHTSVPEILEDETETPDLGTTHFLIDTNIDEEVITKIDDTMPICTSVPTLQEDSLSMQSYSPIAIGKEIIVSTTNGKVMRIGDNSYYYNESGDYFTIWDTAIEIPELCDIISVFAHVDSYFAIDKKGTVWAWGDNADGQLGLGDIGYVNKPVIVDGVNGIKHISFDDFNTFFLTDDMHVMTCGYGQNKPVYLDIDVLQNVKDFRNGIVLKKDGTVYSMKYNYWNPLELEHIPINDKIVSIYSSEYSRMKYAKAEDGTIYRIVSYRSVEKNPPKIKLPSNIVEMSQSGEILITRDGVIMAAFGTNAQNTELNNVIIIIEAHFNGYGAFDFGNTGIVLKNDGTIYQYILDSDGSFSKVTIIPTIDNVGPVMPLYKNQSIGQDGVQSIEDVRKTYGQ